MENFRIQDPDPYNNSYGSASLMGGGGAVKGQVLTVNCVSGPLLGRIQILYGIVPYPAKCKVSSTQIKVYFLFRGSHKQPHSLLP